ncbi:MAG: hypothetical protein ALECFALPRED_003465 [Alectoria fallacina]|uniref:FAD-binding domain-containing protein n=1 Tax=Alectoria fallacina TaxID=1903189 RepID=A0A8H3FNH8_9LECA|nr:MAG: hypothetical protein ALECFALPRED_003465 [Alectoria fallacina]
MAELRLQIAIIGAGLGGLAAAIGIARAGHKVTILEQAPLLGEIGAGIQIPPNSSRILKSYGLLDKIEVVSVRPSDFIIRSYRDGAILSKQNMVPYAEKRYGVPYLHIHRADYHRILVAEAERLGVKLQLGSTVTKIDFDTASVQIRDKPDFHADLILGADGLKSICRESLLGHVDPPRLTGDLAYRIVIKAEDMKMHPNLRELAEKPAINYWMGPYGHVVCYLLQGGGLYNIVLICPDNLPEMMNTIKADLQEMREFFAGWDPKLKMLLGLVQETTKWRLLNSEEMESWSHPSGKFALLGDACHATLPYLAQGAAQAVEDGAVLGALFERIEQKSQISDILTIYERLRKERTTRVVKGSTALRDIFHMTDGERQQERDRQLTQQEPFEGYPNRWADPVFQEYLFGYDAFAEVDMAWTRYKKGTFPGTTGHFKSNL